MSENEGWEEEAFDRLYSDVILDRAEFNKLLETVYPDHRYEDINFREIEINGQKYTIEVLQTVFDGNTPDTVNTHIFVVKEEGGE